MTKPQNRLPRRLAALVALAVTAAFASYPACSDDPVSETPDAADTIDTAAPIPDVEDVEAPDPNAFCGSEVNRFDWDPVAGTSLVAFPDDFLTRDDDIAITGLRVSLGDPAWLADESEVFRPVWRQLEELDGFGTSAGIVLRFSAPIAAPPRTAVESVVSDAIQLWDLGRAGFPAQRVAYEAQLLEGGKTLILHPIRPLRESQLHAVVVTTAHTAADGGCIAPSQPLKDLLLDQTGQSEAPAIRRLSARKSFFLSQTRLPANRVSALSLFTTQTIFAKTLSQRLDIFSRNYAWKTAPTCATAGTLKKCSGVMTAYDYRIEGYLGQIKDPVTYDLPVHVWLKATQTTRAPVMFFGHGLGGDAREVGPIAEVAAASNLATVAISAPRHGDHPTARAGGDASMALLDLFGIDMSTLSINGFVFRENMRQAAFDKLQVLQLLTQKPDIDGDGTPDLETTRTAYWGISLGGIMGPDFVGLSDKVDAAIFSIAGARLISIVTDGENFADFFELLSNLAGGRDALLRLASPAQALIDAGDPINWASRMLEGRFDARRPPHVLVQMVMGDAVVPNVATEALARALEIPQVPTIIAPIDPLRAEATAPVSANLENRTAGLFQFDRITRDGQSQTATHDNVFSGSEALTQIDTFLKSWIFDVQASPVIMNPYAR